MVGNFTVSYRITTAAGYFYVKMVYVVATSVADGTGNVMENDVSEI